MREALIGAAPLLTGGLFVAFTGVSRLNLPELWVQLETGGLSALHNTSTALLGRQDFWI